MAVTIQCKDFLLGDQDVTQLWSETIKFRQVEIIAAQVTIRCVTENEILKLNKRYRHTATKTNVLTFSYGNEHDVAICLPVAMSEAKSRGNSLTNYVALLLVHAFLHITGMDHENSVAEAAETVVAERHILSTAGFSPYSLTE